MNEKILNLFSEVLLYPDKKTINNSELLYNELTKLDPAMGDVFLPFLMTIKTLNLNELEELYTLTFDIQAPCSLDLGYVLFGEDYKRGEFLVNVSAMQREFNPNLKSSELADHLPNVLNLHSKMPEVGIKKDFTQKIMMPGIEKMLQSFKGDLEVSNIYARILTCLKNYLSRDYKMDSSILEVAHV
jgi:nitrate reductase assembly molybdenum cofactor insertion protein NarJ